MINVYDFCSACEDGTTVKVSIYDYDSNVFMSSIILMDAKTGVKALSAVCAFSFVESFYINNNVICCKVHVHGCDLS